MMFKTHVVIALAAALLLFPLFSIDRTVFLLVFLFGALFADIDTPASFIGKRFRLIGLVFSHRGIFHSIFMAVFLSGIIFIFDKSLALVFGLGYFLHMITDMLTKNGVAAFYPVSQKRIRGYVKSGGISEKIIFLAFLALDFGLLLR